MHIIGRLGSSHPLKKALKLNILIYRLLVSKILKDKKFTDILNSLNAMVAERLNLLSYLLK